MNQKSLQKFVIWSMGTLVVPAGLAAYGAPWPIVFAVTLMLTVGAGVGAFPGYRAWFLLGLVGSGVFAAWTVHRERDYKITFQFCRNQDYYLVNGEPKLHHYWIGIRLINDSPFDLQTSVDREVVTLGAAAAETVHAPQKNGVFAFPRKAPFALLSDKFSMWPPVDLATVSTGHIDYVVRYGRDANKLDKTLR